MDDLSAQAKANPRLRQAYDLRTTPEDGSQRILNAVEPGTVLPIHRHRGSTETIVCLRGKVVQHYFDDNGNKIASYVLAPYPPHSNMVPERVEGFLRRLFYPLAKQTKARNSNPSTASAPHPHSYSA